MMCLNFLNPVLMSGNVGSKFVRKQYFFIGDFLFFLILFSRISFLLYLKCKIYELFIHIFLSLGGLVSFIIPMILIYIYRQNAPQVYYCKHGSNISSHVM